MRRHGRRWVCVSATTSASPVCLAHPSVSASLPLQRRFVPHCHVLRLKRIPRRAPWSGGPLLSLNHFAQMGELQPGWWHLRVASHSLPKVFSMEVGNAS